MKNLSAMLLCDFYKISHRKMYPEKTELVYSTWIPRTSRIEGVNNVVFFGLQAFIKTYLIEFFNDNFFKRSKQEVVTEYSRIIENTLQVKNPDVSHIEALHDLGYLPLKIKALPEGSVVPLRVPMLVIYNTDPKFFWLTNYIETLISCELWQASTSATLALEYRKLFNAYALETAGSTDFVKFQGHDFSMRGLSSLESAVSSGMGHLLSFCGTDTIPAIQGAEKFYGANVEKELIGTSIPASEHSIQSAYGDDMAYFNNLLTNVHPEGFVSIVSDGYDLWDVLNRVVPTLKDIILARNGRVVIRPDSGDPVKIVTGDPEGKTEAERKGVIELLWNIFGGTINEKGYKVLDSHIGCIYGDAITLTRANDICSRLKAKGFASTNMIYGIGSYTYQYNTRDTFGFAIKSTLCVIDGVEIQIFKDPVTDNGIKKSAKGAVRVFETNGVLSYCDELSLEEANYNTLLKDVFVDGNLLVDDTFSTIRDRLAGKQLLGV
jgi:nicotinamide phosphoribosyltransferase